MYIKSNRAKQSKNSKLHIIAKLKKLAAKDTLKIEIFLENLFCKFCLRINTYTYNKKPVKFSSENYNKI